MHHIDTGTELADRGDWKYDFYGRIHAGICDQSGIFCHDRLDIAADDLILEQAMPENSSCGTMQCGHARIKKERCKDNCVKHRS